MKIMLKKDTCTNSLKIVFWDTAKQNALMKQTNTIAHIYNLIDLSISNFRLDNIWSYFTLNLFTIDKK